MPEHFKALIVVMGIALPIFMLARQPLVAAGYNEDVFRRHRNLWIVVTLLAFLAHSFWLYIVLAAIVLFFAVRQDREPLALYFVVLFAAPHFTMLLPGIGPIQNLFYVNHVRMLSLVILLPLALMTRRLRNVPQQSFWIPDFWVIGYLAVMVIAHARSDSVTMILRTMLYLWVDIWLPYYVASRTITSMEQFRQLAYGFVLATVILAAIAVFETLRGWMLYESLRAPMGALLERGSRYISRGDGGPLRALASTTFPIILGYVLAVALGMYAFIGMRIQPRWRRMIGGLCLVAGLIAAFSRGPWVGAAAMGLLITVIGPGKGKRLTLAIGLGGFSVLGLLASPWGQTVLNYLPFIGSVDSSSIDYRGRLFDVSLLVFWQNPVFGDLNYFENALLDQIRQIQGQGFIDVVNTYLQVALPYGLLGLVFFTGALLVPVHGAWRARKVVIQENSDAERLGRALLAIMLGILVTIGTTSTMAAIGPIYWIMAGLCVAYARVMNPPGMQKLARHRIDARRRSSERHASSRIRGPNSQLGKPADTNIRRGILGKVEKRKNSGLT